MEDLSQLQANINRTLKQSMKNEFNGGARDKVPEQFNHQMASGSLVINSFNDEILMRNVQNKIQGDKNLNYKQIPV